MLIKFGGGMDVLTMAEGGGSSNDGNERMTLATWGNSGGDEDAFDWFVGFTAEPRFGGKAFCSLRRTISESVISFPHAGDTSALGGKAFSSLIRTISESVISFPHDGNASALSDVSTLSVGFFATETLLFEELVSFV